MREVLTAAAAAAQAAHPTLANRVSIRRRALHLKVEDGPFGTVTLPDAAPALRGDGGTLRDALRLQLSIWQSVTEDNAALLDALRATFDAAPWRWLGYSELVEQPGDLLQIVVALGYSHRVPAP